MTGPPPAHPHQRGHLVAGDSLRAPGRILLVSCYELGHAPHGLAMPLGFLERAGFAPRAVDLSIDPLRDALVDEAALVAISVPMHTALRLGVRAAERVRARNPAARICFFGLYAPLNRDYLCGTERRGGEAGGTALADWVLGGESEAALVALAEALDRGDPQPAPPAPVHLGKLAFPRPSRSALAPLSRYARLDTGAGETRLVGYTETSRGCRDTCRHCPVPAVYGGRFFVVPADAVLDDIAAQVATGARHITFGDPDFFNGPGHGMRVLRRMHARWPALSFDITAQVTHLRRHRRHLPELAALGCAFVVSAVESLSDAVLARLHKRHRANDVHEALDLCAAAGLAMRPTFVAFTPWTTLDDMRALVDFIAARGLVDHVDPVQLTIRLLVPPGSLLLAESPACFGALDPAALTHRWDHPDPRMDALQRAMARRVEEDARRGTDAARTFATLRALVYEAAGAAVPPADAAPRARVRVPRVTEPWFC